MKSYPIAVLLFLSASLSWTSFLSPEPDHLVLLKNALTRPEKRTEQQARLDKIEGMLNRQAEWKAWDNRHARLSKDEKELVKRIESMGDGDMVVALVSEFTTSTQTYWRQAVMHLNPDRKESFGQAYALFMGEQAPLELIYDFLKAVADKHGDAASLEVRAKLPEKRQAVIGELAKEKYKFHDIKDADEFRFNLLLYRPMTKKAADWEHYSREGKREFNMERADLSKDDRLSLLEKEKYNAYVLEMEKLNMERETRGLDRRGIATFEDWSHQFRVEQERRVQKQFGFAEQMSKQMR